MALQTFSVAPTSTTSATFRAWGSAISAAIAANGMVQTADTGQINWSTVTVSASVNVVAGYEIWRFNDSLQATAPIYFKLEYSSGQATSAANPYVLITTGTGSDGAGNITTSFFPGIPATYQGVTRVGINSFVTNSPLNGAGANAAASNCYVNGDTSALAMFLWPVYTSSTSTGTLVLIERSRNWDGTPNGDGYIFLNSGTGTGSGNSRYIPISYLSNGWTPTQNGTVSNWFQGNSSSSGPGSLNINGTIYPQPVWTHLNARLGGPSQYVLQAMAGDYPGGQFQSITFPHYGTSRTWWSAGLGGSSQWGAWQGGCNSFLFRMS